jgi:uncharacterized protein (DUF1778 family)
VLPTGRSLTDFVVAAADEAARRTIEEMQIIRLSAEDQSSSPRRCSIRAPNDALIRTAKIHAEHVEIR